MKCSWCFHLTQQCPAIIDITIIPSRVWQPKLPHQLGPQSATARLGQRWIQGPRCKDRRKPRDWRCRSQRVPHGSSAQLWVPWHIIFGQRLPFLECNELDILWKYFGHTLYIGHTLDAFTSLGTWAFRKEVAGPRVFRSTESEALIMFWRCFRSLAALCWRNLFEWLLNPCWLTIIYRNFMAVIKPSKIWGYSMTWLINDAWLMLIDNFKGLYLIPSFFSGNHHNSCTESSRGNQSAKVGNPMP